MSVTVIGGTQGQFQTVSGTFSPPFGQGLNNAVESQVARPVRHAGTFSGFEISIDANGTSRSANLRKNGANSNVGIAFADGTSGRFFDTKSDHFAATDTCDYEWVVTGTAYAIGTYSVRFIADVGTSILYSSNFAGNTGTGPFFAALGQGWISGAETSSKFLVRAPGIFSNLINNVTANSAAANNVFISRKNGANGNQTITVTAGTTGVFEDTTHSDSLASGDTIGFENIATTSATIDGYYGFVCAHTGTTSELVGGNPALAFNASGFFTAILLNELGGPTATESNASTPLLIDGKLSNMRNNIFSNTMTGTYTFNFRKNSASGNQLLTVAATTTGTFEDTTHTDTFGTRDLLNYMGSGGTAGTITLGWSATTLTPMTFDWYIPLSEPVRFKPGLAAHLQQFTAYSPNPLTIIPFSWFAALSEPPRFKPGLKPALQQFAAFNPQPFVSFSWMEALSEPVRFKPGLRASQQQFLAQPAQLRPNPNVSGRLAAFDKNHDVFLGGAQEWNQIVSGEVGIHEASFTGAQIGVSKVPAITSARVSISII
jgi:hypothetical protein